MWWRLVYDLLTNTIKRQYINDTFNMGQNLQAA